MRTNVGISKQAFLTLGTYLCVILFHSSSLLSAAAAAISVLFVQAAASLMLPALVKRVDETIRPYMTVLFTVILAVLIYRLYGQLPLSGISLSAVPFPDPAFLLILVPLLVDQVQFPAGYRPRLATKQAALFIAMLLCVSFLREICGFGTILGARVIASGSEPLLFLTHTSGTAFLLLMLTLLALYFYRRITGKPQVLAVLEESNPFTRQPVLDRKVELDHMYTSLFSLLIVVPVMLILYFLTVFALPTDFAFDIILILAVILQGIVIGFLHLFRGRSNPNISRMLMLPWLMPVQTIVLILPYSPSIKSTVLGKGALNGLVGLFLYLLCSWVFVVSILLFCRSIKRKLLFGKRPDLLSGLPLLLLITGLGLMVLAGFGTIPHMLMTF